MSNDLLKAFGIKIVDDPQGELKGFVTTSEINDGVMVSKEHFTHLAY
ncbi:hypothetical protein [Commensalibacter papalotli (ex Botero et al. 2024)]|nr:hypothetical protein [Commensalibacter papalotli (ex Botero et al. 2024)]CAI3958348.1 unnamed protein product [Commensalibacter papalotli (ex Botero et al. 2024)]